MTVSFVFGKNKLTIHTYFWDILIQIFILFCVAVFWGYTDFILLLCMNHNQFSISFSINISLVLPGIHMQLNFM